jgi:CRP/FNR family cyclic AMP-dependent transcriptional regulator
MIRTQKQIRPFNSKAFLTKFVIGKTTLKHKKEQIIFAQGDGADAVFYTLEGQVRLTVVSQRGREAVVGVLGRSNFFGEACLAGQHFRNATATSIGDSTIIRIEKSAMIRILHDDHIFLDLFMVHLLSRNLRIEEDLVDQLFNSCEKRLARNLLLMAQYGKESKIGVIIPKISQEAFDVPPKIKAT